MATFAVRQSMIFLLASMSLFILLIAQPKETEGKVVLANVHLCMMNCGQCKEMYGDYFDGQRCAEYCLASYKVSSPSGAWPAMPDCNEPETVDQFLKLSSESRELGSFKPVSQALLSSYSGVRHAGAQQQQNTLYNSKTGSEFKGSFDRSWKKRINGKLGSSMPRWYFL